MKARLCAWLDRLFALHDENYLAEKLARAVERVIPCLGGDALGLHDALEEYRRAHPRGGE